MSPSRGNPELRVRVAAEVVDRAQEVFPSVKGRSGGLSLAVRKLLHLVLDEPTPAQYGETGRAHQIDALEQQLREQEALPFDDDQATFLKFSARKLLATSDDAVDVLRLRALIGRLHLWELPLTDYERKKS